MKYLPAWFLLLLSWFQPLHVMPWRAWHSEVFAAAAVVWLLAMELGPAARAGRTWSVPCSIGLPLLLALYALVQWSAGQMSYLGDALVLTIYLGLACAAMIVGHAWSLHADVTPGTAGQRLSPLQQLAWVMLLGALVSALLALAQLLSVWPDASWLFQPEGARRPGANLGQPNQLATLLLMGLVSLLYLVENGHISRTLGAVYGACLLLGVVMTESRTGVLSLALITVWWAYGRRCIPWARLRTPGTFMVGWLFVLSLLWFWPRLYASWYFEAAWTPLVNSGPVGRAVVWPQLVEAMLLRPWLGWGLREVPEAHNAVLHAYAVSEPYGYAHNLVLDLALGVGLPLTLVLLWVLGRWVWQRLGQVRDMPTWYAVALVLPLAVHAMTEFPYTYTYLLLPPCLAIGYLEGRLAPGAVWRLSTRVLAGLGGGLVLLMLASVVEYVAVEEDFQVARFEALRIGSTPEGYERPRIYLLTQLDAMLQTARIEPKTGMAPERIEFLRRAAMRFPSTAVQHRYALALALNGQPEEAMRQLKVMRAMHGERHYTRLRAAWLELGQTKHPEIWQLELP